MKDQPHPDSETHAGSQAPLKANRILVVDDNTAIHEDFRRILMDRSADGGMDADDAAFFGTETAEKDSPQFDLDFASQGQEALEKVNAAIEDDNRYAVVFMDVRMPPGWDGIETASRLWEVDPDLQIVICTAYSDYSWDDMVEKLGKTDKLLILRKPFDVIEAEQAAHAFSRKWTLLQESRRHAMFMEQTMDLSPSMIFWVNQDGHIAYANQSACVASSCKLEELIKRDIGSVFTNWKGHGFEELWQQASSKLSFMSENMLKRTDGEEIPVEAIVTILDFQDKKVLCITAQDISERLQTLRQLASARDVALQSARMKSQFLANMSHEIRTPMNGVLGMAELLAATDLTATQKEYVGIINQSGTALLSIINDILDSAKIESGRIELQRVPFSLREVIRGAMQTVIPTADKKGLSLVSHVDSGVTTHLYGDPGRLRQVLLNLISNAVKFTDKGEVSVIVELTHETEDNCTLRFQVKDSGIGINAKQLGEIFQPFTQADNTNRRVHGGTGLGLTISSQIIHTMDGIITAESDPGCGSTFSFTIKLDKAPDMELDLAVPAKLDKDTAMLDLPSPAPTPAPASPGGPRILLAEDNEVNQRVTLLQLEQLGCTADVVTNGQEAVDAVALKPYDIVLMDCQMPVMDGIEATRQIRSVHKQPLRIIALTANAMEEDRQRCMEAGMDDYLSKPLDSKSLTRVLRHSIPTASNDISGGTHSAGSAVDFDRLQEITGNDESLGREITDQYLEQAENILKNMEEQIHNGNHDEVTKLAHKLAGSSATCGMMAIVAPLREIEALKPSESARAVALHQQSKNQLMRIRHALSEGS